MVRPLLMLVLALASCASVPSPAQRPPPPPRYSDRSSKLDVYLGGRALDQNDWDPVDNQGTLGLEFVHEDRGSVVGFEIGLFASGSTKENVNLGGGVTGDVRGRTSELSLGFRKTFEIDEGTIHPYVGAGVSAIRADLKGTSGNASASDDDGSGGIYFHGGVDFDLGPSLLLGVDLRFLGGTDITLFGANGSADYAQLALVLGVRF